VLRPADAHVEPDRQLTSLPGIGPKLAEQIEQRLGVTTLEELEKAARAGRLAEVGVGPKRLRGLLDALAGRLEKGREPAALVGEPTVDELLEVDEQYRRMAAEEKLPTVTPRRYNPEHQRWLPLWTTERGGWKYRLLYSNTALAHRLGTTLDWVVIYFEDAHHSGQRTVVTEVRGDLRGRRVVRGRERECRAHHGPVAASGEPAA
jgi:hypothetical protein